MPNSIGATCNLNVGDTHAGGTIIYLDETGCHGIVAAQHDIVTTPPLDAPYPGMTRWHTQPTISYLTQTAILTGDTNTALIYSNSGTSLEYAAKLCTDYTSGGYTDWYLPSKDELGLIFTNRATVGNFLEIDSDIRRAHYWSSSKASFDRAWSCQFYAYGTFTAGLFTQHEANSSGNASRVRAVRKF